MLVRVFGHVEMFSEKLKELQENLIRSHAAGVGKALTPEKTRMLLALRFPIKFPVLER